MDAHLLTLAEIGFEEEGEPVGTRNHHHIAYQQAAHAGNEREQEILLQHLPEQPPACGTIGTPYAHLADAPVHTARHHAAHVHGRNEQEGQQHRHHLAQEVLHVDVLVRAERVLPEGVGLAPEMEDHVVGTVHAGRIDAILHAGHTLPERIHVGSPSQQHEQPEGTHIGCPAVCVFLDAYGFPQVGVAA